MPVELPYVSDKFIVYEGDAIKTNLSLAVWLEDGFTGKAPVGRIKVSLKETQNAPRKEAFQNLSGYYCFIDLDGGNYILNVESEYFLSEESEMVIAPPNQQAQPSISEVKKEIKLKPKVSYPFPAGATLVTGKVTSNETPFFGAKVRANILKAACYNEEEFVEFLDSNPGREEILEPYKHLTNNSVCIFPGEVAEDDAADLGDAFDALEEKANAIFKGEACFTHSEYKNYLSSNLLDEGIKEVMDRYEILKNGKVCIDPAQISEDDRNILKDDAFDKLEQMAKEDVGNQACFTIREYNTYIKKYLLDEDILTRYEKQKTNKVCIDLDEVSIEDKNKLPEEAYKKLVEQTVKETKTDAKGIFVLFFKGLKNKKERIVVEIKIDGDHNTKFINLTEGATHYLDIQFP
jgi:hypothetical protein